MKRVMDSPGAFAKPFIRIVDNIAALIDVKSILSFSIVYGVLWGFKNDKLPSEVFAAMAGSIVTYFFNKVKNAIERGKEDEDRA